MKRLFVDMDGTLAVFNPVETLEELYEKGYFYNLKPIEQTIEAVKKIIENDNDIEVFVLSAYLTDSQYALHEKMAWMDKNLPEVDAEHRIFTPCGQDKKIYIENLSKDDYLLDDYTKNLTRWEPPAKGIKFLNGINNHKGTWKSTRLSYEKTGKQLADNIEDIMNNDAVIIDDAPPQKSFEELWRERELREQMDEDYNDPFHIFRHKLKR